MRILCIGDSNTWGYDPESGWRHQNRWTKVLQKLMPEHEIVEEDLYRQLLLGKLSVNEGMFFENAIAQELTSKGHKLFFYTHYSTEKHRNDIEIDFVISNKSKTKYKIFPIEVKSSERYSIKSLERFIEKYKERIGVAYVIHPKNLKVTENILYIPADMTMCLE